MPKLEQASSRVCFFHTSEKLRTAIANVSRALLSDNPVFGNTSADCPRETQHDCLYLERFFELYAAISQFRSLLPGKGACQGLCCYAEHVGRPMSVVLSDYVESSMVAVDRLLKRINLTEVAEASRKAMNKSSKEAILTATLCHEIRKKLRKGLPEQQIVDDLVDDESVRSLNLDKSGVRFFVDKVKENQWDIEKSTTY